MRDGQFVILGSLYNEKKNQITEHEPDLDYGSLY